MAKYVVTEASINVNPTSGDTTLTAMVEYEGDAYPIGAGNVVDASSTRASVEKYIREEVARQIKEKSDRTEKVAKITATVEKIGLPQEFEIGTTPKKKPKDKRVKEGS